MPKFAHLNKEVLKNLEKSQKDNLAIEEKRKKRNQLKHVLKEYTINCLMKKENALQKKIICLENELAKKTSELELQKGMTAVVSSELEAQKKIVEAFINYEFEISDHSMRATEAESEGEYSVSGADFLSSVSEHKKSIRAVESSGARAKSAVRSRSAGDGDVHGSLGSGVSESIFSTEGKNQSRDSRSLADRNDDLIKNNGCASPPDVSSLCDYLYGAGSPGLFQVVEDPSSVVSEDMPSNVGFGYK